MATNVAAPFGFAQRSGTGSSPTYEQVEGIIDYNTAAIFFGDPVFRLTADGTLAGITTGPGPGTTAIAGIFVGCHYLSVAQKRTVWSNYWPGSDVASTNSVTGYIVNDPNAQWVAQVGGSSSAGLTAATNGANLQFAYGTGNTANGISGAYIDVTVTPAVTSTLPFRQVGLLTSPPGAPGTASGAYNLVIVAFNNVETKNLTATL
jgi:hypothetical protein